MRQHVNKVPALQRMPGVGAACGVVEAKDRHSRKKSRW
jgi:hypothetical protein